MAQGQSPGFRVVVSLADRATRGLQSLNQNIAGATTRLQAMATLPGRLAAATGFDRVGASVANIGRQALNLRNSIAGTIAPFARLGVIVGAVGLAAFTTSTVKAAGELRNLTATTGISIENLQGLQYAAAQQNISADALTGSLTKMSVALGNATKPSKKLTETQLALSKGLGFSMEEIRAGTIAPQEAFLRLADAMQRIQDPAARARFAAAILGKGWKDTMPLLTQGRAAIEAQGAAAAKMSTETTLAAAKFGDQMVTLGNHIRGVAYDALAVLIPEMNSAALGMDEWAQANKVWLRDTIVEVVRDLVGIVKAFGEFINTIVIPAIKTLEPLWRTFEELVGANNARLLLFGAVVAPKVLAALAGLTLALGQFWIAMGRATILTFTKSLGALFTGISYLPAAFTAAKTAMAAFNAVMFANPVGIVIAAIAALAAAAFLIWRYWEPIAEFFSGLWDGIKAVFWSAVDWVAEFADAFTPQWIKDAWAVFTEWWGPIWDGVKLAFWSAIDWLGEFAATWVPQPIQNAWAIFTGWAGELWAGIKSTFDDALSWLGSFAGQFVAQPIIDAWSGLTSFFQRLWDGVTGIFENAWNKIQPYVGWLVEGVGKVVGAFASVGSNIASFFGFGDAAATAAPAGVPAPAAMAAIPAAVPAPAAMAAAPVVVPAAAVPVPGTAAPPAVGRQAAAVQPAGPAPAAPVTEAPGGAQAIERFAAAVAQAVEAGRQQLEAGKQQLEAAKQFLAAKATIAVNFANAPEGMNASIVGSTGAIEVTLATQFAGPRAPVGVAY